MLTPLWCHTAVGLPCSSGHPSTSPCWVVLLVLFLSPWCCLFQMSRLDSVCSSGTLPSFTFLRVRMFPHLFAACTVVFYSLGCEGHLVCLCVLVVMKKAACPFLGIFCVVVFSVPLTESRNIMAELCPHCCGTMIWYSVKICYLYFNKI